MCHQSLELLRPIADCPRIRSLVSDAPAQLTLWVLEQRKPVDDFKLLYGLVIAADREPQEKWTSCQVQGWQTIGGHRFRFYRLVLVRSGIELARLVESLLKGHSLAESSELASIEPPKRGPDLYLAKEEMEGEFVLSPTRFQLTNDSLWPVTPQVRPPTSPMSDTPAFVASIRPRVADSLWQDSENDSLVRQCIETLSKDAPFDFDSNNSSRLGQIEWIALPTANDRERSAVSVTPEPGGHFLVKLSLPEPVEAERLFFRFRVFAGAEIVHDDLTEQPAAQESEVRFGPYPESGRILFSIWERRPGTRMATILHEHDVTFISKISTTWAVPIARGTVEIPWLNAAGAKNGTHDDVGKIQRINVQESAFDIDPDTRWICDAREIRSTVGRLCPPKSKGKFFEKGWNEGGALSFLKWLRERLADQTTGAVVLADPYFDEIGLDFMMRAAEYTAVNHTILTCTQKRSEDDGSSTATKDEPVRAKKIRDEYLRLRPALANLRFQVCDLRSTSGGNKQLFHDRYLLFFDPNGRVLSGFALSNSIQNATKKHPFLATPIPDDLLTPVGDYVKRLLEADTSLVPHAQVERLCDSSVCKKRMERPLKPQSDPELTSTLARNPSLGAAVEDASVLLLRGGTSVRAIRFAQLGERWAKCLEHEGVIDGLIRCSNGKISEIARDFLMDALETPEPLGIAGIGERIAGGLHELSALQEFDERLKLANELLIRPAYLHLEDGRCPWGITLALNLVTRSAAATAAILDATLSLQSTKDSQYLVHQLVQLVGFALHIDLLRKTEAYHHDVASTKQPILSALACASAVQGVVDYKFDDTFAFSVVSQLDNPDRLHALAFWSNRLCVTANRAGYQWTVPRRHQLDRVLDHLVEAWDESLDANTMRMIASTACGPRLGDWVQTITRQVIDPLIAQDKLSIETAFSLWWEPLCAKWLMNCERNRCERNQTVHFGSHGDLELTQSVAYLASRMDSKCLSKLRCCLKKQLKKPLQILDRPFIRTKNYNEWHNAAMVVCWVGSLVRLVAIYLSEAGCDREAKTFISVLDDVDVRLLEPIELRGQGPFLELAKLAEYVSNHEDQAKT
ncbi:MAG: VPA1262 family N-terminal domain-containing protein [Myxococcota bacterium]